MIGKVTLANGERGVYTQPLPPIAQKSFNVRRIYSVFSDTLESPTSVDFATLPGMEISFRIPGTTKTTIIASYTAEVKTDPNETLLVRAILDEDTNPKTYPSYGTYFVINSVDWSTHAFNFIIPGVHPGTHTVGIQWKSQNGGIVKTYGRSLVVYAK